MKANAANYKTHVLIVYQRVMAARNNFSVFYEKTTVDTGTKYRDSKQWYWQDHYLNQRHGPFGSTKDPERSGEQNAHDDMERFRPVALAEKRKQLGDPEDSFLGVINGLINFEGFAK